MNHFLRSFPFGVGITFTAMEINVFSNCTCHILTRHLLYLLGYDWNLVSELFTRLNIYRSLEINYIHYKEVIYLWQITKTMSVGEFPDNYKSFAVLVPKSHSKFGVRLDCTLEITLESSPRWRIQSPYTFLRFVLLSFFRLKKDE